MENLYKFIPLVLAALLFSCKSDNEAQNRFEYTQLKKIKYPEGHINAGTEIELLAFSGGPKSNKDIIYYYQFIGIDKSSGDTVRILSSLISVNNTEGLNDRTYTTPLQYDPAKGITTAEFQLSDSSQQFLAEFNADASSNEKLSEEKIKDMMEGKSGKKELVVINKGIDLFQGDYKTVVGVLNFKKIPW